MKKTFILPVLIGLTILLATAIVSAQVSMTTAGSGSIWTTNGDCGDETQDVNEYDISYIDLGPPTPCSILAALTGYIAVPAT